MTAKHAPGLIGIASDTLYTSQQIQQGLQMGHETFTYWVDNGLPVIQAGTKAALVLGSDLIEFLKTKKLAPKPKTYAEKQALRQQRPKP